MRIPVRPIAGIALSTATAAGMVLALPATSSAAIGGGSVSYNYFYDSGLDIDHIEVTITGLRTNHRSADCETYVQTRQVAPVPNPYIVDQDGGGGSADSNGVVNISYIVETHDIPFGNYLVHTICEAGNHAATQYRRFAFQQILLEP